MARKRVRRKEDGTLSEVDLRTLLVDVSIQLFARSSYDNTSVQNICDSAGVTKGAFYHYFESKEAALSEIYGRMFRLQMTQLEEISDSDAEVLDRLRQIAKGVVTSSLERIDEATVFWRSLPSLSPEAQHEIRVERRKYHLKLRSLIEQGQREGSVRGDISADMLINFYYGSVHQLDAWFHTDGPLSTEEVGDCYSELFISILTGGPTRTDSPSGGTRHASNIEP